LVVEVLSPSNVEWDMLIKLNKYLKAGVKEYWIVDPDKEAVYVNILEGSQYTLHKYAKDNDVAAHVLDGCIISLPDVFAEF
jgi:Uma2 family endonuclease